MPLCVGGLFDAFADFLGGHLKAGYTWITAKPAIEIVPRD
jgi:hypothetical protein